MSSVAKNLGNSFQWSDFTGLAEFYDYRPAYPREAVEEINALLLNEPASGLVVELGCGTGLFTRLLSQHLCRRQRIVAIEPNEDMRHRAAEITPADSGIEYIDGVAEMLPFDVGAVQVLAAAGAAPRFDRPRFYPEAARVLSPNGVLAFVHNKFRYGESDFLQIYLNLLENRVPEYRRDRRPNSEGSYDELDLSDELRHRKEFTNVTVKCWEWTERLDRRSFLGLTLSSTVVQKAIKSACQDDLTDKILSAFDSFTADIGYVELPYYTEGIFARRSVN